MFEALRTVGRLSNYVEVPDAEMAPEDPPGPGRDEFFIEHLDFLAPPPAPAEGV